MGIGGRVTVKIPKTMNPFPVKINGEEFMFEAGQIVEVPYWVAEIINSASPPTKPVKKLAMTNVSVTDAAGNPQLKPIPEGYPNIIKEYTPLVEVQEVNFPVSGGSQGVGLQDQFVLVEGQTYVVIWDGTEYERVAKTFSSTPYFGNLALAGAGENTGEPFLCAMLSGKVAWFADTAAIHTIGVSLVSKTVTPMAEYFLPVLTSPNGTKYKLTVDDSGTISATEVT